MAVVNFLAFLGWNPGTEQEIYSIEQLIADFDLERVNKAGARFDPDKTKWFNHHYMQQQLDLDLAYVFKENQTELSEIDVNYIAQVVGLIKERATFISDFWELSHFFFEAPSTYDEKAAKKALKDDTNNILKTIIELVANTEDFTIEQLQTNIKGWITDNGIGFGKVMMPLRLALVGALQGPDVFDIMYLIGKNDTVRRIEALINNN